MFTDLQIDLFAFLVAFATLISIAPFVFDVFSPPIVTTAKLLKPISPLTSLTFTSLFFGASAARDIFGSLFAALSSGTCFNTQSSPRLAPNMSHCPLPLYELALQLADSLEAMSKRWNDVDPELICEVIGIVLVTVVLLAICYLSSLESNAPTYYDSDGPTVKKNTTIIPATKPDSTSDSAADDHAEVCGPDQISMLESIDLFS